MIYRCVFFYGVVLDFNTQFEVAVGLAAPYTAIFEAFKLASCAMILFTGIFTMKHQEAAEKLLTVRQKTKMAMLIYFIPLLVLAIPMLLSGLFILPIQTFIIMFSPVLALPLFHILACILAKELKDQKKREMF